MMNSSFSGNVSSMSTITTTSIAPVSVGELSGLLAPVYTDCCDNQSDLNQLNYNSSIELSIFRLQGTKKHIVEGCLITSAVSLVASFLVYCILPELRTVPGKCLMGLIVSELITDCLAIAALQYPPQTTTCFVIGVLIHFFFLTIISWTSVIAFDLLKKFKYPNQQLRHFVRYIFYVYLFPLTVVGIAVFIEFSPRTTHSLLRPHYGKRICAVSAPISKLIFVTIPINVSLLGNLVIFLIAIFKIKQVVNEISHSSISTSMRERCLWYIKLSLLLGVSSLFGFFGIQLPCCQTLKFGTFLINSLHGTFIFIAFTLKRSTFRLLAKHLLPCRQVKSAAVIGVDGSKKSTRFAVEGNGNDSRESSLRMASREAVYRGHGFGFATTTTITSSSENTPQRGVQLPLHSFGQLDPNRASSYRNFDSIVIVTAALQGCEENHVNLVHSKDASPVTTPTAPT